MNLFEDLTWRGLVHQVTHPDMCERLQRDRFVVYAGFDPTADSLHIGHLMGIIGLMHFQRAGHRPIALVGGATGMVGDPSGKSEERKLQTVDDLAQFADAIRRQLEPFLDFSGENGAILANNADWLGKLNFIDFLRDVGKHFSVNAMVARESVRARLEDREHGISYTEFSYMLLQAYDFLHLYDSYQCKLQVGGSDQWGNILSGMDLIRRLRNDETFGLTWPLVTKPDGTKFGKTESGAVWLDPNRTSPYKFYQFWINQTDAETPKWLRTFTFLSREAIEALEQTIAEAPEKREAQRKLAEEVTRMVHGPESLANAIKATEAMFGGSLSGLDDATLEDVFSEVPTVELRKSILGEDRLLLDVLVECGIFKSKGEARRLIQNGGLYLNNEKVSGDDLKLTERSLCGERIAVARTGKRNYHLLKFVE
jgi:tyrosyl-tRNA synthetase